MIGVGLAVGWRPTGGPLDWAAAVGHEALLAVAYFGAVGILAACLAGWLFRHRTAGR